MTATTEPARDARPALLLILASLGALGTALASQYWGGLAPCELCLWQRWAYAAAIGALLPGLFVTGRPGAQAAILAMGGVAFLAGAGIAMFHVGVEQKWWTGLTGCTNPASGATSVEDLLRQLEAAPIARCDEIAWSLFGISMAGFNVLASLALAAFAVHAARAAWAGNRARNTERDMAGAEA